MYKGNVCKISELHRHFIVLHGCSNITTLAHVLCGCNNLVPWIGYLSGVCVCIYEIFHFVVIGVTFFMHTHIQVIFQLLIIVFSVYAHMWIQVIIFLVSLLFSVCAHACERGIWKPDFNWWFKDVLKRRYHIIAKFESKYWCTTHKFGIRVKNPVKEDLHINNENRN